jgi:hypothetical protein
METGMNMDEEKSYIYIEFEDLGSVNITYSSFNNVTAYQLLAMAHLLEFEGKNHLAIDKAAQMQAEMQRPKIEVPKSNIELGKK